jgi:hypothetical protein
MKKTRRVERVINDILELYWEDGYEVKELIIPDEWLEAWSNYHNFSEKYIPGSTIGIYETDFGTTKVFRSPSKHMNVIISPK